MSNVIVTAAGRFEALIVRASLTVHIAHRVAEAFTKSKEESYPLHDLLVSTFGGHSFRWYCLDMSANHVDITFSNQTNPRVLHFQGSPAVIANADREFFSLRIQHSDLIKPGRLNPQAPHPHVME